ncbi:hypothetical protein [Methylobacter sp. sgz302048]|uniref:hypothetical protein n=1 Tax=Methylobacter sp. sgz302048 TaxID=3455945 RepID=UPI003FA0099E
MKIYTLAAILFFYAITSHGIEPNSASILKADVAVDFRCSGSPPLEGIEENAESDLQYDMQDNDAIFELGDGDSADELGGNEAVCGGSNGDDLINGAEGQ